MSLAAAVQQELAVDLGTLRGGRIVARAMTAIGRSSAAEPRAYGFGDERPYRRLVIPDDLVTDQALQEGAKDEFGHAAIARAVGDLTLSTITPVNIALFGPWGSGKSSFYHLMSRRIDQQDKNVAVVRYDAWKFGGQALKANFIQHVAAAAGVAKLGDLDRELNLAQEQSRIRLWAWLHTNWRSIGGAFLIAMAFAAVWVAIHAALLSGTIHPADHFWRKASQRTGEFGLVMAAVLTTVLLGPQAIAASVVKTTRPAVERDDQFIRLFRELIDRIKNQKKARRIVIFIDELDRCEPEDVVATLVDLKTFLDVPDCVFVVAADRDVIERALRGVPQAKPVREDDPYYSTPGAFLDKIFQHQIALPPLRSHALSSFAHALVSDRTAGVWRDLQHHDPSGRLFNDVTYILIPGHVSSPRRVKVLLNNFATTARVAQSRGIDWIDRAQELAFLTVLETEFPSVAALLIGFPELLAYLRRDKALSASDPDDLRRVVEQFDASTATAGESVAGAILRDDDAKVTLDSEQVANRRLARQLHDYLDKLRVVTVPDPRPDLLYLRVNGYDEGMRDPNLGEMIDLAADRSPDVVVAAFGGEPPATRTVAVDLLIRNLPTTRGTGRANLVESACRLAQTLTEPFLRDVSHLAPEVATQPDGSSMRNKAIPGAIFLLAANDQSTSGSVKALIDQLDLSDDGDLALLQACLPALGWMDDESATHVHAAVGVASETSTDALVEVLRAPESVAARAWKDLAPEIGVQFKSTTGQEVFADIVEAILTSPTPADVLMSVLVAALDTKVPALIAAIHTRRDVFMSTLHVDDATCIALYEIELGAPAQWPDWLPFLDAPGKTSRQVSKWAQDAAIAIGELAPTEAIDLTTAFDRVAMLIRKKERPGVAAALIKQVPDMPWGDTADPNAIRWKNLHAMLQQVANRAERGKYWDAVTESLVRSIESNLPSVTSVPAPLLDEWRGCIERLPKPNAKRVDEAVAPIAAPSINATVDQLRLQVAARLRYGGGPLPVATVVAIAGGTAASAAVVEWLALKPAATSVLAVHKAIPIERRALAAHSKSLSPPARTRLWTGIEASGGALADLRAVGQYGLTGEAIKHMRSKILTPPRHQDRRAAVKRLLSARFAEVGGPTDHQNREVGHKEASRLAVDLIDAGGYENVILAAQIIIHSEGCGYGTKNKLRSAFTSFASGDQTTNFTRAQARALKELGLLTVRRRGPFGRLLSRR